MYCKVPVIKPSARAFHARAFHARPALVTQRRSLSAAATESRAGVAPAPPAGSKDASKDDVNIPSPEEVAEMAAEAVEVATATGSTVMKAVKKLIPPAPVVVLGAEGLIGIKVVLQLLNDGFNVIAGVSDEEEANTTLAFFKRYELVASTGIKNLKIQEINDLTEMPRGCKVVVIENDVVDGSKTDARMISSIVSAAEAIKASQLVVVSVPESNKGFVAASAPNATLSQTEKAALESSVPFVLLRVTGFGQESRSSARISLSPLGTAPGGTTSESQLTSVLSQVLKQTADTKGGLALEVGATAGSSTVDLSAIVVAAVSDPASAKELAPFSGKTAPPPANLFGAPKAKAAAKPQPAPKAKAAPSDDDDDEEEKDGGLFGMFGTKKIQKAVSVPPTPRAAPTPAFKRSVSAKSSDDDEEEEEKDGGLFGLFGSKKIKKADSAPPTPRAAPTPVFKRSVSAKASDDDDEEEEKDGGLFGLFGSKKIKRADSAPPTPRASPRAAPTPVLKRSVSAKASDDDEEEEKDGGLFGMFGTRKIKKAVSAPPTPRASPRAAPTPVFKRSVSAKSSDDDVEVEAGGGLFGLFGTRKVKASAPAAAKPVPKPAPKPVPKPVFKPAPKRVVSAKSSDDDVEVEAGGGLFGLFGTRKVKASAPAAAKPVAKPVPKPVPKPAPKPAFKPKRAVDSDDDDEEEDAGLFGLFGTRKVKAKVAAPPPPRKAAPAPKQGGSIFKPLAPSRGLNVPESGTVSSRGVVKRAPPPPVKRAPPPPAPKRRGAPVDDDDEDEEKPSGFFGMFGAKKKDAPAAPPPTRGTTKVKAGSQKIVAKPPPPPPKRAPPPPKRSSKASSDSDDDDEDEPGGLFGLFGTRKVKATPSSGTTKSSTVRAGTTKVGTTKVGTTKVGTTKVKAAPPPPKRAPPPPPKTSSAPPAKPQSKAVFKPVSGYMVAPPKKK